MVKKKITKKKAIPKARLATKTKAVLAKKSATKREATGQEKPKTTIPIDHVQTHAADELIQKIVCAVDIDEKVRWSWGLMAECRALESSPATNKHIAKCKSCQDFLNARKSLAELIVKAGRI